MTGSPSRWGLQSWTQSSRNARQSWIVTRGVSRWMVRGRRARFQEVAEIDEKLVVILEEFADKAERQSHREQDAWRKAYRAGKAEGLRLAKDLVEIIGDGGLNDRR